MKPLLRRTLLLKGQRWTILHRTRSPYGVLWVVQRSDGPDRTRRRLINDELIQNTYDPIRRQSLSAFTGALTGLATAYAEKLDTALCIGTGAGIVPRQLAERGAAVDAVEINPKMAQVAQQYFDLDPDAVRLITGEGRAFAAQSRDTYDVVVIDAFLGRSVRPHLFTLEALVTLRERLSPSGVLLINSFGEFDARRRQVSANLDCTLREVFGSRSVGAHASGKGNVFHVATRRRDLAPVQAPDFSGEHPELQPRLKATWEAEREFEPGHGRLWTDAMLSSESQAHAQ